MKGKKCLKLLVLSLSVVFSWVLISCFSTSDVSAVSINSIVASQSSFSKNFDSTILYQTLNSQPLPAYVLSTDANMTGFWDYSLNFVFNNPVQNHSGTGFSHSIRFTLTSNGDFLNSNLLNYMATARIGFENINVNLPYCTSSFGVVSMTSNSVRFEIVNSCPYGSYSSTQNFSSVLSVINYHPESLFWCANDNPNQLCPSNPIYITLSDVEYYFKTLTSESDSYNETIINQNQTIINNQNELNDWLKDDTPPSADTSIISGASGWLPQGPVDSLLTLPMTFAQGIVDIFTGQHECSPIVLPFDFINSSITIPCLDSFFAMSGVNLIWNGVGTIIAAFVLYDTFKWLYKFVDDTLTFRENNSGLWGGL